MRIFKEQRQYKTVVKKTLLYIKICLLKLVDENADPWQHLAVYFGNS